MDRHPIRNERNKKYIAQLRNDKATGTDGIPGEMYKTLTTHIYEFMLQIIMNKIMGGEDVPKQ